MMKMVMSEDIAFITGEWLSFSLLQYSFSLITSRSLSVLVKR